MQPGLHRVEVVADVSSEVRGVVGIHRRAQTTLQEARQRMVGERVDDPQPDVRQRAHGQRDTLGCQPGHEAIVLDAAHPMVDAFDVENVERLPDVVGRAFLPRVRDSAQPLRTRTVVDVLELRRGIAGFPRVESDADDVFLVRERGFERAHRLGLGKMAEEAQDQFRGDGELVSALGQRALDPLDDGTHRDPARRVRLRIEEDLRVADALRVRTL